MTKGKKVVELTFREESNLIVIPIKINDKGPYNFILDTGSGSGLIFDQFVIPEHDLVNAKRIPIFAKEGYKVSNLLVAHDIKVSFTDILGEDQSMLVLEDNNIDIRNILGVDAHGVLGSEIFNRFVVKVDYKEKKLTLYEPQGYTPPKGFHKIDISIHEFRPFVKSKIKQKGHKTTDVNLLIDTGASSAIFLDAKRNDNIHLPKKLVEHSLGSSLSGTLMGNVGRVGKFWLGDKFRFKKVLSSFPDDWAVKNSIKVFGENEIRHGTIGSEVLSRFTVIFDYLHGAMYLKKNRDYNEDFEFNTAGFTFAAEGKTLNTLYISRIIENSPAEKAGLKEGDELIALNSRPMFYFSFSQLQSILRNDPGKNISVIVRRDGQLIEVLLRLKRLV